MRINEAKSLLAEIVRFNLTEYENGKNTSAYLLPMFIGDPGVGKTAIPVQVAEEAEIPYFQTIVAQFDPGELAGLPFIGETLIPTGKVFKDKDGIEQEEVRSESRMIRLRPSYLPDINNPTQRIGVYNLDEMPQAMLAGQNVMSQLVNEWRIGEHLLSRGITICATGNKPENKAGTTTMPTHLRDRLMFIEVEPHIDDTLPFFAKRNVNPRIRSYLRQHSQKLHKFTVGANANPTPRSWEKSSAILSLDLAKTVRTEALAGQLGSGEATEFETWLRVEDRMPDPDKVISDPAHAPVFGNADADILYLLLASLADKATAQNVGAILTYIDRLPNKEFVGYFAQDAFGRDESLLQVKEVTKWKMTSGAKLALF